MRKLNYIKFEDKKVFLPKSKWFAQMCLVVSLTVRNLSPFWCRSPIIACPFIVHSHCHVFYYLIYTLNVDLYNLLLCIVYRSSHPLTRQTIKHSTQIHQLLVCSHNCTPCTKIIGSITKFRPHISWLKP